MRSKFCLLFAVLIFIPNISESKSVSWKEGKYGEIQELRQAPVLLPNPNGARPCEESATPKILRVDVNCDQKFDQGDVLHLVNAFNRNGIMAVDHGDPLDVDGDGTIRPYDILLIIACLKKFGGVDRVVFSFNSAP